MGLSVTAPFGPHLGDDSLEESVTWIAKNISQSRVSLKNSSEIRVQQAMENVMFGRFSGISHDSKLLVKPKWYHRVTP